MTPRRTKGPDKATWATPDFDVIQSARDVVAASRGTRRDSVVDQGDDRVRAEIAKVKAVRSRYEGSPVVQDEMNKVRNAVKASPAGLNNSQVTATPPPFLPSPVVYDVPSRETATPGGDTVGQLQRAISGRETRASRMLAEREGLVAQQSRELAEMEGRMNEMKEFHAIEVANLEGKASALQRQVQKALTNESRMSPKKNVVELESRYRETVLRAESAENEINRLSDELTNASELLHAMQDDANKERLANANIVSQTRLDIRKELEQAHLDIVEDQRQGFEDEVTARELANKRQIDSLVAELESLRREFVIVENECDQYKRECKDATGELKKQKSELAVAGLTDAQSLEEMKGHNERNLIVINDLKIMNKRLQGREGALEARIVELELAAGLAQEEAAGEERMKAASEMGRIQDKHRHQSKKDAEELGRLRGMLSAYEAKLELSEETAASLEMKLEQSQRRVTDLEAVSISVSNQVDLREMEIEHAENKVAQLEKSLAENRQLLGRQAGQLQASHDRSAILEAELNEMKDRSDLSERGYASMTAESSEARVTIELQAAELQKARHTQELQERRVDEINKELQERRVELEQTSGYLESCRIKLEQSKQCSRGLEAALQQQASTLRAQLQVDAESVFTLRLSRERSEWEATSMELEQHLEVACQRRIWQASAAANAMLSADVLKSLARSYACLRLFSGIQKLKSAKNGSDKLIEERDSAKRRVLQLQEEYDMLQHEGVMMTEEAQVNYDSMVKQKQMELAGQCLYVAGKQVQDCLISRYLHIWMRWAACKAEAQKAVTCKAVVMKAMHDRSTQHAISAAFHAWYRWAMLIRMRTLLHQKECTQVDLEEAFVTSKATVESLDRTLKETVQKHNALVEAKKDLENTNMGLEMEVEKYRKTCEAFKNNNQEWQKTKEESAMLEVEIEGLQRKLKHAESESVTLMQDRHKVSEEAKQASKEANDHIEIEQQKVREAEQAAEALRQELTAKAEEVEGHLRDVVILQEELEDCKVLNSELRETEEGSAALVKTKDKELADLSHVRQKVERLEDLVATERREARELQGKVDSTKKELALMAQEKVDMSKKLSSMHDFKEELLVERDTSLVLQEDLEKCQQELVDEQEVVGELREANLKLRGELEAEFMKQSYAMKADMSDRDNEIADLQEKLRGAAREVRELEREKTTQSAQSDLAEVISHTAEGILDNVKSTHDDALHQCREDLQKVVTECRAPMQKMTLRLRELEKESVVAKGLSNQRNEQLRENESLKQQLEELDKEHAAAKDSIEELQKELETVRAEQRTPAPITPEPASSDDTRNRTVPVGSPPFSEGSVEPPNPPSPHIEPIESAPPASPSSPLSNKDKRRTTPGDTTLTEDDKTMMQWVFQYGDVDGDGFLNYEELKRLSEDTTEQRVDRSQYEDILSALNADERGLNLAHLEQLYCVLGDPRDVKENYNALQSRVKAQEVEKPTEPCEPPTIPESEVHQIESPRAYEEEVPAEPESAVAQQYIQSPPPPPPPAPVEEVKEASASSPEPVEEIQSEALEATPEASMPASPQSEAPPSSYSPPVEYSPARSIDEPSSPTTKSDRSRSGSVTSMMSKASFRKAVAYPYGKLGSVPFRIAPASARGEVPVKVASSTKSIPKGALIVEVANPATGETTKVATRRHFLNATANVLEGTELVVKVVTDAAYLKEWEGELIRMGKKVKYPHEAMKKKGTALFKELKVPVAPLDAAQKKSTLEGLQTRIKKAKLRASAEGIMKLHVDPESFKNQLFKDAKDHTGPEGLKVILSRLEAACSYPAPAASKIGVTSAEAFDDIWQVAREHYLHAFDRETREKSKAK